MTKQQIIERLKLFSSSYERMADIFKDTNDNASAAILAVKADVDSLIQKSEIEDPKVFIYFEEMDDTIFSTSTFLETLPGWGEYDEDKALAAWLESAEIGNVFFHRSGICVRLASAETQGER